MAYTNLSWLYVQKGQWDRAIEAAGKAIELNPKLYDAYFNRGSAYFAKGDMTNALADMNAALAINQNLAPAYNYRGKLNVNNGDLTQALSDFSNAIAIDPDMAEAYKMRGLVYVVLKDSQNAAADLNKAVQLNDTDPMAYFYRGHLYNANHDFDKAVDDLDRALVLGSSTDITLTTADPFKIDLASIYMERAISRRGKLLLNDAIADARKAAELDPGSALIQATLGELLITNADIENGLAAINKAIKIDPAVPENYINRAAAYDILSQTNKDPRYYALIAADMQKVIEISKDAQQVEDARASIRYMQGKGYIP
jgi:tetratricopeptide (TPR) repeat protein